MNSGGRTATPTFDQPRQKFQLQKMMQGKPLEDLEKAVKAGVLLLNTLKSPLVGKLPDDAAQWIEQIERIKKQAAKTKTIVGVVGNTGAGKSSVSMIDKSKMLNRKANSTTGHQRNAR